MTFSSTPSAKEIRLRILEIAFSGQTVHIPSAFSIVEIIRVLHREYLRYPRGQHDSKDRDYLVLSKGHGVMALYPILEARGWIDQHALANYFQDGSQLPGLCEASIPGCEANSGSLGQGVGVAAGLALAIELRGSSQRVFCVVGDGELNEGSTFEALSFVGQRRFRHFALVVDLNGLQAMGATKEVISQDGLDQILRGLGFHVLSVNGHDESALSEIFRTFVAGKFLGPIAILAQTVKGKGVSFMEGQNAWHYKRLNPETMQEATREVLDS